MNQIENFKKGVEALSTWGFGLVFTRKAKTPSGQMIAEFAHKGAEDKEDRMVLVVSEDGSAKMVKKNGAGEKTTLVTSNNALNACMHYEDQLNGRKPRVLFN